MQCIYCSSIIYYKLLKKFEIRTERITEIWREKVGVAGLKPTRYDNLKGTRIGPYLFYTSKLYNKYIKIIEGLISY